MASLKNGVLANVSVGATIDSDDLVKKIKLALAKSENEISTKEGFKIDITKNIASQFKGLKSEFQKEISDIQTQINSINVNKLLKDLKGFESSFNSYKFDFGKGRTNDAKNLLNTITELKKAGVDANAEIARLMPNLMKDLTKNPSAKEMIPVALDTKPLQNSIEEIKNNAKEIDKYISFAESSIGKQKLESGFELTNVKDQIAVIEKELQKLETLKKSGRDKYVVNEYEEAKDITPTIENLQKKLEGLKEKKASLISEFQSANEEILISSNKAEKSGESLAGSYNKVESEISSVNSQLKETKTLMSDVAKSSEEINFKSSKQGIAYSLQSPQFGKTYFGESDSAPTTLKNLFQGSEYGVMGGGLFYGDDLKDIKSFHKINNKDRKDLFGENLDNFQIFIQDLDRLNMYKNETIEEAKQYHKLMGKLQTYALGEALPESKNILEELWGEGAGEEYSYGYNTQINTKQLYEEYLANYKTEKKLVYEDFEKFMQNIIEQIKSSEPYIDDGELYFKDTSKLKQNISSQFGKLHGYEGVNNNALNDRFYSGTEIGSVIFDQDRIDYAVAKAKDFEEAARLGQLLITEGIKAIPEENLINATQNTKAEEDVLSAKKDVNKTLDETINKEKQITDELEKQSTLEKEVNDSASKSPDINNQSLKERLDYLKNIQTQSKFMETAEERLSDMEDKAWDVGGNNPKSEADSQKKIEKYETLEQNIENAKHALDGFEDTYERVLVTMKNGDQVEVFDLSDLDELKLNAKQISDIQFFPYVDENVSELNTSIDSVENNVKQLGVTVTQEESEMISKAEELTNKLKEQESEVERLKQENSELEANADGWYRDYLEENNAKEFWVDEAREAQQSLEATSQELEKVRAEAEQTKQAMEGMVPASQAKGDTTEAQAMELLAQNVTKVTEAVKLKTEAFELEKQTVTTGATEEISSLDGIAKKVSEVKTLLASNNEENLALHVPLDIDDSISSTNINNWLIANKEKFKLNVDVVANSENSDIVPQNLNTNSTKLNNFLSKTQEAVTKTQLSVNVATGRIIADLQELVTKINTTLAEVKKIKDVNISANIDIKGISSAKVESLNKLSEVNFTALKESLKGNWTNKLQGIGDALKILNVDKKSADNMQKLANAILNLKSNLNNLGSGGAEFINSIDQILTHSKELENLVTILKATKIQMAEVKETMSQPIATDTTANEISEETKSIETETKALEKNAEARKKVSSERPLNLTANQNYEKFDTSEQAYAQFLSMYNEAMKDGSFVVGSKRQDQFRMVLKGVGNQLDEVTVKLDKYNRIISTINTKNAITGFERLKNQMASSFYYFKSYASGYMVAQKVIQITREAIQTIFDLDDALVDIKKTFKGTDQDLQNLYQNASSLAQELGVTTKEILEQEAAWSRAGYSLKETTEQMAKMSSIFASISPDMDTDKAQSGLISVMKAFDIDTVNVEREILDNVNAIGNNFATSNGNIISGLEKSSAAMAAANNTLEETIALFTGGVEITQDAEAMGAALRTISMRIRGYDEELEEMTDEYANLSGEIADLTKSASTPGGISLFTDSSHTEYKSTIQILREIAAIWDEITDKQQADLLQKLFGKTRAQQGAAILTNFDQVEAALKTMEEAAGSADAEMANVRDSLSYKANAIKQEWVGTWQSLIDSDSVKVLLDSLLKISEAIGWVADSLGMGGLAGALAAIGIGKSGNTFVTMFEGLGKQFQNIKQFSGGISLLSKALSSSDLEFVNAVNMMNSNGALDSDNALSLIKTYDGLSLSVKKISKDFIKGRITEEAFVDGLKSMKDNAGSLSSSFKNLSPVVKNLIAVMAVELVIAGFKALDKQIGITYDTIQQKAADAKSELEETQSEIESLNSQLETTNEQIKAIQDKGTLTFVDEQELDKLKQTTAELEAQLKIKEKLKAKEEQTANITANRALNSWKGLGGLDYVGMAYGNSKSLDASGVISEAITTTDSSLVKFATDRINELYAEEKELNEKLANATDQKEIDRLTKELKNNQKIRDKIISSVQDSVDALWNLLPNLTGDKYEETSGLLNDYANAGADGEKPTVTVADYFSENANSLSRLQMLYEQMQNGEINKETFENQKDFTDAVEETGVTYEELTRHIKETVDEIRKATDEQKNYNTVALESTQSLGEGLDSLSSIYEDVKNGEGFDYSSLFSDDFKEKFSSYSDEYNKFVETVANSPSDINACQEAFNDLATAYINGSGALDDLTEETKDATTAMLKQMGVSNAEEVVTEALKNNARSLGAAKRAVVEAGKDFKTITLEEINALKEEGKITEEVRQTMILLAMQEKIVNGALDTNAGVQQLINLAKQAGITITALQELADVEAMTAHISALRTSIENSSKDGHQARQGDLEQLQREEAKLEKLKNQVTTTVNDSINNKKAQISTPLNFTGGSSTGKDSSSKSGSDSAETFDWVERAIEKVEKEIDRLDDKASDTWRSWSSRNGALSDELGKVQQQMGQMASAYEYYMQKANAIPLPDYYKNLVMNGGLLIEEIQDETLKKNIKEFQDLYDKAEQCKDKMEELRDKIAQIAKQKFDNLQKEFEGMLSLIEHTANMVDKFISRTETRGYVMSKKYYETLIGNTESQIGKLQEEYDGLAKNMKEALDSGAIENYSEEWYNMASAVNAVEEKIADATNKLYEYQKAMREVDWKVFELQEEYISRIQDESDFLIELISDRNDLYDKDKGMFTSAGKAVVGLHAVNYDAYMAQADDYYAEIQKIQKEMANDPYNTDLIAHRNELLDLQQDAILAAEDEKQKIKELVEDAYNNLLEVLQKIIDKRKEALEAEKSLYEYEKKVREQTENIAKLQKQLEAYGGDDSEETRATIQKLKVDLENANEELNETEYDKWLEDQERLMDDFYNEVEEWMNGRLDSIEDILVDMINQTNENAAEIYDVILSETDKVGYTLTDEMDTIWSQAAAGFQDAVTLYDYNFQNYSASVLTTIDGVKVMIQDMINHSDMYAQQLISSINNAANILGSGMMAMAATNAPVTSTSTSSPTSTTSSTTSKPQEKYYIANANGSKNSGVTSSLGGPWSSAAEAQRALYEGWSDGDINSMTPYITKKFHRGLLEGLVGEGASQLSDFDLLRKISIKPFADDEVPAILQKGEAVMTPEQMHNIANAVRLSDYDAGLYQMQQKFISSALGDNGIIDNMRSGAYGDIINANKGNGASGGTVNNDITLNLALPNVNDVDGFISELQTNKRFEKVIQAMTIDTAMGKNSLSKYKY